LLYQDIMKGLRGGFSIDYYLPRRVEAKLMIGNMRR
jgi:hypothetical protein